MNIQADEETKMQAEALQTPDQVREWVAGVHARWVARQREERRSRREAQRRYVHAHQSVRQDWTRQYAGRPSDIREEVWINPFFEPESYVSDREQRFVEMRRLRRRRLRQPTF